MGRSDSTFTLLSILVFFTSYAVSLESAMDECEQSRKIAFVAHLTNKNEHMPSGTPIIFPMVEMNDGNGYNSTTGTFTAPISGVYTFSTHLCNANSEAMVSAIMKGNDKLSISTVHEDSISSCGSDNTIVRLQEGDEIKVVAQWTHSEIRADTTTRVNSFTGFLLY